MRTNDAVVVSPERQIMRAALDQMITASPAPVAEDDLKPQTYVLHRWGAIAFG